MALKQYVYGLYHKRESGGRVVLTSIHHVFGVADQGLHGEDCFNRHRVIYPTDRTDR